VRRRGNFIAVILNPAVDRTIEVERLRPGAVIRGRLVHLEPAGKGVNVAHSLAALGHAVVCTGFVGRGETAMFERSLLGAGAKPSLVQVSGVTRESITYIETSAGRETHIVDQGFEVSNRDVRRLRRRLLGLAQPDAWLVLNGRPAQGLTVQDYHSLLGDVRRTGAHVAVDTSGEFLRAAVLAGPELIKPNDEELSELAGARLRRLTDLLNAARELACSIPYVVVSLGPRGALCATQRRAWYAKELRRVPIVHTVGCGDALVAGFVAGLAEGLTAPEALRLAVACGGACARSPRAALRSRREADSVLPNVRVRLL